MVRIRCIVVVCEMTRIAGRRETRIHIARMARRAGGICMRARQRESRVAVMLKISAKPAIHSDVTGLACDGKSRG